MQLGWAAGVLEGLTLLGEQGGEGSQQFAGLWSSGVEVHREPRCFQHRTRSIARGATGQ